MRILRTEHTLRLTEQEYNLISLALTEYAMAFDWKDWSKRDPDDEVYQEGALLVELCRDFGTELPPVQELAKE